jgi:hypothetical protein
VKTISARPCLAAAAAALLLGACQDNGPDRNQAAQEQPKAQPVRAPATPLPEGTTPMAERVAVIGLLNKRNGISRDLTLRPGEASRADDVIIRLQACETTPPHEVQQLTGAFVQVDVRNLQNQFQRAFSGWLYRESPSLNVVEHPVYDVWVKSCAMTHPGSVPEDEAPDSNRSSASNSASPAPTTGRPRTPPAARPEPSAPKAEPSNAADNN